MNKYRYLHVLQGNYGDSWEYINESEDRSEIQADFDAYIDNAGDQAQYRIIQRRELNKTADTMTVEFIQKNHNQKTDTREYYFQVDGELYQLAYTKGVYRLLNGDGRLVPMAANNDFGNIKKRLIELHKHYINY